MIHSASQNTHRVAETPVVGWQPIQTVPLDETAVLVFGMVEGQPAIAVREFDKHRFSCDPYIGGHDWSDFLADAGITHWKPLPEGPA